MRKRTGLAVVIIALTILIMWNMPALADWGKWTPGGTAVCTEGGTQQYLVSCSGDAQSTFLVWFDNRPTNPGIYAQKLDADGNPLWTPASGVKVNSDAYTYWGQYLDFVPDGSGGIIVVYSYTTYVLCAQRLDATGSRIWNGGLDVLLAMLNLNQGITSVDLIPDGSGGVIMACGWFERIWNYETEEYDNYWCVAVQKVDAGGNLVWNPYTNVPGVPVEGYQDAPTCNPRLIPDGSGGAVVAWIAYNDVKAAGINASTGFPQWNQQVNIGNYTHVDVDKNSPQIVSDGLGGALISWNHRVTYYENHHWYRIYNQRINSSGIAQWTSDTQVTICYPTDADHCVISDDAGGAIYVFGSKDPGDEQYKWLWSQRINGDGNQVWTGGDVLVAEITLVDKQFSAAQDGEGGAITAWSDARNTNHDIYAQRLDATGTKKWGEWGLAICTEPNAQSAPVITYHGDEGVVIAWRDTRADGGDIYAQRMDNCYLEITNIAVNTTFNSSSHTWDAEFTFETNLPATSVVAYDPDMDCYPACSYSQEQAGPEETNHTVLLTDLAAANSYCYRITVESEADPLDNPATVTGSFDLTGGPGEIYDISHACGSKPIGSFIKVQWKTKFPSKENKVFWRKCGFFLWSVTSANGQDCDEDRYYTCSFPVEEGIDYEFKISTKIDGMLYQSGAMTRQCGDDGLPIPKLDQNQKMTKSFLEAHPNPFNPQTTITFNLPEAAEIELKIYSVSGEYVTTLASGFHSQSIHCIEWNGTNYRGESVSSGIYFAMLTIKGIDVLKSKLLLLK